MRLIVQATLLIAVTGASVNAETTALSGEQPTSRNIAEEETGRPTAVLASTYHDYTIPLRSFVPVPGHVAGAILMVRINGGSRLRMLLDSGAESVLLRRESTGPAHLTGERDISIVGLGQRPVKSGQRAIAKTVEIGSLVYRDCPIDIVPGRLGEGIDGVVPLGLFQEFVVRLDLPRRKLELQPYGKRSVEPSEAHFGATGPRTKRKNALLLLPAKLNSGIEGYVMLDTGAFYSVVSRDIAKLIDPLFLRPKRQVQASTGTSDAHVLSSPVRFHVAGRDVDVYDAVSMDLNGIGSFNGRYLAGLLGYPELSHFVVTVDYRNGLVSLDPKR